MIKTTPFKMVFIIRDIMKSNKDILASVLKTAQMGQTGIRSVMKAKPSEGLKKALDSQKDEYNAIEAEAQAIANRRGWVLPELPFMAKAMSDMMSRAMLMYDGSDSKIAAMTIQGNMRGVLKGLKNQHRYAGKDPGISELAQKLLDCENENIRQMEAYL